MQFKNELPQKKNIDENYLNNSEDKILNSTFISIFIANALMNLSQQMTNSLISKYANYLGATATTIGIVMGMFTYSAIALKIISAPALDSFNRKYLLAGAMSVMGLSYLGYGLSTSIPVLMASRILQGAGQAFTATGSLALAADSLPKDRLGSGLGLFSTAQAICQAIGPTIGLWLVSLLGYNNTFYIGSIIMFLAACVALRVKIVEKERKPFKISIENIIAKEALLPSFIVLLLSTSFCTINSFLIIYATGMNVNSIGLFFTVYASTLLLTRPLVGRLSDRFGLWKILIPAVIIFSIAFLIISIATSLPMFLLAAFVSAFGYGSCQPAIQTLSMKSVPNERRGSASCTNYIGTDIGNLIGPVFAGIIIETFGFKIMWRFMLIPVALALVVIIVSKDKIEHIEKGFI